MSTMNVPADLRRQIQTMACDMGVPPAWVLRAALETWAKADDLDQVLAVEAVRDALRVLRMPRYHRAVTTAAAQGGDRAIGRHIGNSASSGESVENVGVSGDSESGTKEVP